MASVIRIKPYHYIHVLDNNSNVTSVIVGPKTFTRQDHEKVVSGPSEMILIPPRHYCVIANPVTRDSKGKAVVDTNGNAKLRHGDEEIRFQQEPFPLYPGEELRGKVQALQVVAPNAALRLRCIRDFIQGEGEKATKRVAGDEWLWEGPGTYYPRVEVQVVEIVRATVIKPNFALRLRARKACVDNHGTPRAAGEEWIIRQTGAYLPSVDEEIVAEIKAHILTDKVALHLRASRTFVDVFKVERKAGSEWLVTYLDAETHIPDVYEDVVGQVRITTLTNRQYCVVLDPVGADGKPDLGKRELRQGPLSFFLRPGERLEQGIQNVYVLTAEEALLLRAKEQFQDGTEVRQPGNRWMIYGPRDYIPPVEVEIVEKRTSIPLDENEGIYVRDITTGKVRTVIGKCTMLKPTEELWPKDLPKAIEDLLPGGNKRDKSKVISFRAPHNSAVQIMIIKKRKLE